MGRRFDPDRAHDSVSFCERGVKVILVRALDKIRDLVLVSLVLLTFVVVTPWNNLDGTNPGKFLVLVSLGTVSFTVTLFRLVKKIFSKELDVFNSLALIAVFLIFVSLTFNRYALDERLFGLYGRSLGAITFLTLFLVMIASSFFDPDRWKWMNLGILFSLLLIGTYFAIQLAGLDVASWEDAYGGIPSSTLGNPNFVSSSLAILSAPLIAGLLCKTRLNITIRLGISPLIAMICYLMWETQSLQGLIILAFIFLGFSLIRFNEILSNRFGKLVQALIISLIVAIPVVTFLIALGFTPQRGGATLIARTEYWRAAWNLILENPLFGKGFDSFGDWYWAYRDQLAVDRSPGLFTDSTHNLLLELAVFGGLPLLITYLILQGMALRSALRIVLQNGNLQIKTLVLAWIGFNLQSAISPSNLALTALGFTLTGIVYGAGRDLALKETGNQTRRATNTRTVRMGLAARMFISTLAVAIAGVGTYLGATPIVKDARFRDAIERGDGQGMIDVSRQWPFNYQLSRQTAITLKANSYDYLAIDIVRDLVEENPYNIQGWRMLFDYSTASTERSMALSKMRELDPLNPELTKLTP